MTDLEKTKFLIAGMFYIQNKEGRNYAPVYHYVEKS